MAIDSQDPEVRKEVTVVKTELKPQRQSLGTDRFKRFSTFASLRRAIAVLIARVRCFKSH